MSERVRERSTPESYCALIALVLASIAALSTMSVKDYQPSALVHLSERDPIARIALSDDPAFATFPREHYDGIYFYAIARDPFARGVEHELIDLPGARYGHALYGWLAGILSFGTPRLIPLALMAINLVAMTAGAYSTSLLSKRLGWSPWGGLFFALNPGLLFAVTVSTSEVLGSCLLIVGLLSWFRRRWLSAGVAFALLCLAKEPYVLAVAGLGLWELVNAGWNWRDGEVRRKLGILLIGPALAILWQIYLFTAFDRWAFTDYGNTGLPFVGIGDTLALAAFESEVGSGYISQIAQLSIPVLISAVGACLVGIAFAFRSRTQIAFVFLGLAPLNFLLNWHNLYFAKDLLRQFSTTLLLLPLVIAAASLLGDREGSAPPAGP